MAEATEIRAVSRIDGGEQERSGWPFSIGARGYSPRGHGDTERRAKAKSELTEVAEATEIRAVSRVDIGVGRNGPDAGRRRAGSVYCWSAAGLPMGDPVQQTFRTPMAQGGTSEPYPVPNNAIIEPGAAGFEGPFPCQPD